MASLPKRLGMSVPLVQAGMGGGIADHRLAVAVSQAGGLGTIGFVAADALAREIDRARRLTGRPIAANLLLPFARSAHWRAVRGADAVITFWGRPRRRTDRLWLHQCGSVGEARAAVAAGADGIVVQGVEAGGHVRGRAGALELLAGVREALPSRVPLLLAGGIATRDDVRRALDAGAAAAVCGTRFLLSDESAAHPGYKRLLVEADRTVLTELFGFGWPAPHRVVPNAATERWLRRRSRGPAAVRALNRLTAPLAARVPPAAAARLAAAQRPAIPLLGPQPPIEGSPPGTLTAAPLYAGETVARIGDVRPAGEIVAALAP